MSLKNIKKSLIFSGLGIGALATLITLPIVYQEKNSKTKNFSISERKEIEKGIDLFFTNFKNNLKTFSFDGENKINFSDEVLIKIKKEAFKFATNNKNINDMKNNLKNLVEKNGYSWEKITNNLNVTKETKTNKTIKNFGLSISSNDTYGEAMEKINETAKKAAIFGGIASSIAAGYWAAVAFSFGATTASAIAATTQATVLFAEGAILGGLYLTYQNNENKEYLKDVPINSDIYNGYQNYYIPYQKISEIVSLVQIIKGFVPVINTSIIAIKSVVMATSWAAPSALALLGLLDLTTTIFSLF